MPPVAVKMVVSPKQIASSLPAKALGRGLTITETVSEFTQPFHVVALTIYSVVSVGNAIGLAIVSSVNVLLGVHK